MKRLTAPIRTINFLIYQLFIGQIIRGMIQTFDN